MAKRREFIGPWRLVNLPHRRRWVRPLTRYGCGLAYPWPRVWREGLWWLVGPPVEYD